MEDAGAGARTTAGRREAPHTALPPQRGVLLRGLLPNGLRLLVWYDPDLELEDACLSVAVGSQLDMEHKQGAAALVADIIREGHSDGVPASELAAVWEKDGYPLEVRCDEDAASYLLSLDPGNLKDALEAFDQLITRCDLREEDFEHERLRAIMRYNNRSPWGDADVAVRRDLYHQYGYHRAPHGTPEGLGNITRDICQGYYHQYYRPNNSVLVLTGPVPPEEARKAAQRAFSDWKYGYVPPSNPNEPPPLPRRVSAALDAHDDVCAVVGGAVVPHLSLEERVALEVWAEALGTQSPSAPFDSLSPGLIRRGELRRHRLCDEVRFAWSTSDSLLQSSIRDWLGEMRDAAGARPWVAFERSRNACLQRLVDDTHWTMEAARSTLFGWPVDTPDELRRAAMAVDAEHVRAVARRCLGPDRWALVVTAPRDLWQPALLGYNP